MRTAIIMLCVCGFLSSHSVAADAVNIHTVLQYLTRDAAGSTWRLRDDSDGKGPYIEKWQSSVAKPTKAQIIAAWPDAQAWAKAQDVAKKSDIDTADERLKLVIKALVICVNKRLPAGNKITLDEMRTEISKLLGE